MKEKGPEGQGMGGAVKVELWSRRFPMTREKGEVPFHRGHARMWASRSTPCNLLWLLCALSGSKGKYNVGMESEAGESHFVYRIPHSGSQLGIHSTEITLCQVSGHRRYSVISWSSEPSPPSASLPWPCLDCSQHRIPWVASLPAVWANAS